MATPRIKFLVVEKDGVELEFHEEQLLDALSVFFDNSENNFVSDNVQEALEEAKQNAEGFPRAGIRATMNGTVGNNNWLGPNELLPATPIAMFPVTTKLNEVSWSNNISRANRQFELEFRRGSKTGPIFYTMVVTSPNPGYGYVGNLNFTFAPGEAIFVQYKDTGKNCADMDLVLWISRIADS